MDGDDGTPPSRERLSLLTWGEEERSVCWWLYIILCSSFFLLIPDQSVGRSVARSVANDELTSSSFFSSLPAAAAAVHRWLIRMGTAESILHPGKAQTVSRWCCCVSIIFSPTLSTQVASRFVESDFKIILMLLLPSACLRLQKKRPTEGLV